MIPAISNEYIKYHKKNKKELQFCLFLGDRIETAAYAITAMYLQQTLIHIFGGDIGNLPHFDHNIRHSITKMSHLHLVTNDQSFKVLKQLGEQEWRICNIGMPSLDIVNNQTTIPEEILIKNLNLKSNELILSTYHPDHYLPPEQTLNNFKTMIEGLKNSGKEVILTYPNNDPGYKLIISEIENNVTKINNIKIIKNLGINIYISLLKNLKTILIGNSSSIITESPFFLIPSLLLGSRQKDRYRGINVTELETFTSNDITKFISGTFNNYESLQNSFKSTQFIHGNGQSAQKTVEFIKRIFTEHSKYDIISKHFIIY